MDSTQPVKTLRTIERRELDACIGQVYRRLIAGGSMTDALDQMCGGIAESCGATLVTLGRAAPYGVVETVAQSSECPLWAEIHRVPERWDDSLAGAGAAVSALRGGEPVVVGVTDPRLRLWRPALESAHVGLVLAWPFEAGGQSYVLELFATLPADATLAGRADLAAAVRALARVVEDAARLARQQMLAAALESAGTGAFVTDLEGRIVWCNRAFCELSGYREDQVIGNNPRFLKSGQQGVRYYRELWSTIRSGHVWSGETVDRDREGRSYTIHQTVSPVAQDKRVTHYVSIHLDLTREKQRRELLERGVAELPAEPVPAHH